MNIKGCECDFEKNKKITIRYDNDTEVALTAQGYAEKEIPTVTSDEVDVLANAMMKEKTALKPEGLVLDSNELMKVLKCAARNRLERDKMIEAGNSKIDTAIAKIKKIIEEIEKGN